MGVLDSGVGGLSVLVHLRVLLPGEHLIYFADQAHIPYGPRPPAEVRAYTAATPRRARVASRLMTKSDNMSGTSVPASALGWVANP